MQFDIEEIRKRPGMYTGSTGAKGIYHLISRLAEEFICIDDKAMSIAFTVNSDTSLLLVCDRFLSEENNLDLFVIKALSDIFEVTYGNEQSDSTNILFHIDKKLFTYEKLDYSRLYNRFKELAQLNSHVKFFLEDNENKNCIQYKDGLNSLLYENIYDFPPLDCLPTKIHFIKDDIEVSVSMLLGHDKDVTFSYVNNSKTHGGGSHIQGLYDGVYSAFQKYIVKFKTENIKYTKKDIMNDLNFVLNIKMEQPFYEGNTKRTLGDYKVRHIIKNGVVENLDELMKTDQRFFDSSNIMRMAAFMHVFKKSLKQNNPNEDWDD